MPYNLKHLVHMPNTKQSEIHNSLAPALFALFNSFFAFSNQCVDAIFLQSTLEKKEVLKCVREAVLSVPVWLCGALGGELLWIAQMQTSLPTPPVYWG